MRILFTYYPLYVRWNHGIALLTAICKEQGIEADYFALNRDSKEFIDKINNYHIVGFSFVTDLDYKECLPSMKIAKDLGKQVLSGGVYARRGGIIEGSDLICRGEAEIFPDSSIFNEIYYQSNIDDLPMPDLSHVTGFEFHRGIPALKGKRIIPYQTSRGCPYQCSFCEVQYQPKGLRIKHTIYDDLLLLSKKYQPDLFYLLDEQPPYYSEEWREQWKNLRVPFQCYIRGDIEPRQLEWMIDHGLKVAAFGIESGSEKFRNEVLHKNLSDDQIFTTTKILKKHGILYIPFFMYQIPGETVEDKQATLDMIKKVEGLPMVWTYQDLQASRIC